MKTVLKDSLSVSSFIKVSCQKVLLFGSGPEPRLQIFYVIMVSESIMDLFIQPKNIYTGS